MDYEQFFEGLDVDEWNYDEVVAKIENNAEALGLQNRLLAETLFMIAWQIADNAGFANYGFSEATKDIENTERRLQSELRQCIEEVVEGHFEFQSGELQRRLDRSLERQNKRLESQDRSIDHLNEWRNRSEGKRKALS